MSFVDAKGRQLHERLGSKLHSPCAISWTSVTPKRVSLSLQLILSEQAALHWTGIDP